jgi:hypothetical protein
LRPDAQEGGPKPTLLRSSLQPRSVRRVRFQLEV